MIDLQFLINIWLGTFLSILLVAFTVHFNGRTIISSFAYIKNRFDRNQIQPQTALEAEIILAGLTPLALACLLISAFNICVNSLVLAGITETFVIFLFVLTPGNLQKSREIFGINSLFKNRAIWGWAFVWCLFFAVWTVFAVQINSNNGIDRLLLNTNPDMWAYLRRFSALTTENISFSSNSACHYFLYSPKKLSSFVGSIFIALTNNNYSLAIILFKGLLGCSLFLCLFGDWMYLKFSDRSGKLLYCTLIIWAIASPQIYWLLIWSYISNTLAIIVLCLGLKISRKLSIEGRANSAEFKANLLFFTLCMFSFYPVFLPIALFLYLGANLIYSYKNRANLKQLIRQFAVTALIPGLAIISFYILFQNHFLLGEIQESLNPFSLHGTNFVPLNPWNLLQDDPKPMPIRKDFGVWFNIIVGIIIASFILKKLWQIFARQQQPRENTVSQRDLIAGISLVLLYIGYLLAYIPLEYTYRLGKIAISIFWPLSILALPSFIGWIYLKTSASKFKVGKFLLLSLLTLHALFHIYKVFDLRATPSGKYAAELEGLFDDREKIIIVGCSGVHISQYYEIMAGLRLARENPNSSINVVRNETKLTEVDRENAAIVRGIPISAGDRQICTYEIKL